MDTSFSSDGYIVTNGGFNGDDKAFSIILNADDSILYSGGGHLTTLQYDYFLGLYNASGSTAAGQAFFDYGSLLRDIAYGMGIDSTGKVVLAGSSVATNLNSTFGVARVNANYTVDNTFGTSGKVTTTFGTNVRNEAFDMVIQTDDKIIAVGYTGNDIALARYNGNTLSTGEFDLNYKITLYPNPTKEVVNIDLQNNLSDQEEFKIFDINGRTILNGKVSNGLNQINVESLAKGLYIFNLGNINQKFIKE
ncbi:T9SS type A sorting domain-containing protein [Flavobacterium piscinae]|nr:T9SS type A sorting domain-containing protein [Flavobacterium piscinae]